VTPVGKAWVRKSEKWVSFRSWWYEECTSILRSTTESIRPERIQTAVIATILNSVDSQFMLTAIILLSIWVMFLHFI